MGLSWAPPCSRTTHPFRSDAQIPLSEESGVAPCRNETGRQCCKGSLPARRGKSRCPRTKPDAVSPRSKLPPHAVGAACRCCCSKPEPASISRSRSSMVKKQGPIASSPRHGPETGFRALTARRIDGRKFAPNWPTTTWAIGRPHPPLGVPDCRGQPSFVDSLLDEMTFSHVPSVGMASLPCPCLRGKQISPDSHLSRCMKGIRCRKPAAIFADKTGLSRPVPGGQLAILETAATSSKLTALSLRPATSAPSMNQNPPRATPSCKNILIIGRDLGPLPPPALPGTGHGQGANALFWWGRTAAKIAAGGPMT
jgi:hypothetical protein